MIELLMDDDYAIAQLSAIDPGPYTLDVDTPGYVLSSIPVDVPESGSVIVRAELSKTEITAGIEGRVLDSVSGNRLPASTVRIVEIEVDGAICNVGNYQFPDIASSVYTITASRTGYAPQSLRVAVDQLSVSESDFALTADSRFPGEIRGNVFNVNTGLPFPGVKIRFNIATCDAEIATLTDANGGYSVASLPPGPISVSVEIDGVVEDFTTVTLGENEIATVDFDVFRGNGAPPPICGSGGSTSASASSVLAEFYVLFILLTIGLTLCQRRMKASS